MNIVVKKQIMVSASVSCMDLMNLRTCMVEAEDAGIDFYHFDVVDGRFNNCFILGQTLLEAMRPHTKLPIEVHLAVYEPEKYIAQFAKAGADYIGVHVEAMENPYRVFDRICAHGAMPVLTFKAQTAFDASMEPLLSHVAWINKLTVEPGYSGQKIQPAAIAHIEAMRTQIIMSGMDIPIQADGNMNLTTIPAVIKAGANILTGGTSGLFVKGKCIKDNLYAMLKAAN